MQDFKDKKHTSSKRKWSSTIAGNCLDLNWGVYMPCYANIKKIMAEYFVSSFYENCETKIVINTLYTKLQYCKHFQCWVSEHANVH